MSASAVHSLWTTAAADRADLQDRRAEDRVRATVAHPDRHRRGDHRGPGRGVRPAQVPLLRPGVPVRRRAGRRASPRSSALAAGGYGTHEGAHRGHGRDRRRRTRRCSCRARSCWPRSSRVFTFAERRLDPEAHGNRVDSFAAQAASVPGSDSEKAAVKAGFTTTEVFPLLLFAVAGMLVFPSANDLLTLFVALEVFSLPLYLLCARRPPQAADVAGGRGQVLPARRLRLRLHPLRHRPAVRLRGLGVVRDDRRGRRRHRHERRPGARRHHGQRRAAAHRRRDDRRWACSSRSARCPFHMWTPGRLPGRADPGHRLHGGGDEGGRVRRAAPPAVRRPAGPALGLAAGDVGRRDRHHAGRRDRRDHPDRHQAAAGVLVDRARRASSSPVSSRRPRTASRPSSSTWPRTPS